MSDSRAGGLDRGDTRLRERERREGRKGMGRHRYSNDVDVSLVGWREGKGEEKREKSTYTPIPKRGKKEKKGGRKERRWEGKREGPADLVEGV